MTEITTPTTPTAAEDPPKKEHWVYQGRRLDPKTHKIIYQWCPVDDEGVAQVAATAVYESRIEKQVTHLMPAPGAIFTVHTMKAGSSVKIGGPFAPVYESMLSDAQLTAEWEVAEAADLIRHKINKRMKEEMGEEALEKCLRPIVRAMKKTNSMGKDAIKLVVLNYLARHGGI